MTSEFYKFVLLWQLLSLSGILAEDFIGSSGTAVSEGNRQFASDLYEVIKHKDKKN